MVQVPQPYLLELVSLFPGPLPPLATPAPHSPPIGVGFLPFAPCQDAFLSLPTQIWYYHQNRFPVQWSVIPFVLTTVSCSCHRIVLIAVNCFLMFHEIWLSQTVRPLGVIVKSSMLLFSTRLAWDCVWVQNKKKKFFFSILNEKIHFLDYAPQHKTFPSNQLPGHCWTKLVQVSSEARILTWNAEFRRIARRDKKAFLKINAKK